MTPTFLLIGDGFIAPRHKNAIEHIGGKITDIVTDNPDPNGWKKAIADSTAEYVVVLTPNYLHFPMCQWAAEHNKKVLCEKPLCIKSEDIQTLNAHPNIFAVLQLRHHPLVNVITNGKQSSSKKDIHINISVYRDLNYYSSWKGDGQKSGGLLFNLGIHYFDLLIHLFGSPTKITTSENINNERTASGVLENNNYICHWKISSEAERDKQQRTFTINGVDYNFSSQDNLSYEDLHKKVYEDLIAGRGVRPQDCLASTLLIEKIYGKQ